MKESPPLKLLTPAHIADKKDVTPDSRLRRSAFPAPPIDLLNLLNVKAGYCDLTSWYWHHMVTWSKPNPHRKSTRRLKTWRTLATTFAFLATLLQEHPAAWEAPTPINAADQGMTATTPYYPMAKAELATKTVQRLVTLN